MELDLILTTLTIGLVAGLVGGLAGIGGSIIMLPALGLFIGYQTPEHTEHHLYMAAAMTVNIVVAFSSRAQHRKAGALRPRIVRPLITSMALAIVLGVLLSNVFEGDIARRALILFLFAFCAYTLVTTLRRLPEHEESDQRGGAPLLLAIGAFTGLLAGFLGIGGGLVMVPLLQFLARIPLRLCIATSAAVMWLTALVGAIAKLATLSQHTIEGVPLHLADALALALPMGVGARVGAANGATITHRIRLPLLRVAIATLLAGAGARMAGVGVDEPEPAADHNPTPAQTP
ncbi:MAG: sulfite exporter TauE/SafE family protein [Phycisphaerales bacterium JB059]